MRYRANRRLSPSYVVLMSYFTALILLLVFPPPSWYQPFEASMSSELRLEVQFLPDSNESSGHIIYYLYQKLHTHTHTHTHTHIHTHTHTRKYI